CDGGACCDNTCHFASSGSVCRAANGSCDTAEVCSGASAACPTDSFKPAGTSCSDGSFCNGNEQCNGAGSCLSGNVVDCSANNITGINSCDNDPDNNPFTKDTRDSFNSVCSETTQSCTVGNSTIFHQVPTVGTCGVECNSDSNCLSSEKVCNIGTHQCVNSCGNNIKESWEQCDGSAPEHYSCNSQCKLEYVPYCGDGNTDAGETCDDGTNNGKYGYCNLTCNGRSLHCGDDIVTPPEECDGSEPASCLTDSGYFGTKSCNNSTCGWGNCLTTKKCGDGVVNGLLETCDDGDNNGKYGYCNSTCTAMGEFCGDKTINGTEECDGSAPEHYSCTNQCKLQYIPYCGDGIKNLDTEECDGSAPEHYSCTNQCKLQYIPYCGDGIKNTSSEFCDGSDLGGLPSTDYSCNRSCELNLVNPKVTICHADDSQKKPYVTNTPDKTADVGGHDNHNGGVWYPGIADHSWGDIIPPFYYVGGYYPGQNWTTEGQTIYNNNCQYPSGFINVVKVISNDATNYSDFSFSVNSESPVSFENDGSNQIDAKVGVIYNITETPVSGYEVTYDGCKNISITKGETKTCTITNTKKAKLTVIKQVDTNNDGVIENQNATDWTWDIKNGEQNIATGQTKELVAGSYTISEDQKDAYRLKQWTCSNETRGTTNSIGVVLNPGDDVTCTITNTRRTGNIKVCKVIIDSAGNIVNGASVPASTFTISGLNQSTSQGAPAGVIGTSTFANPLVYSDKLFGSKVDNATCTTYENLVPGNYYYGQESISSNYWTVPKYNDGVVSQNNINDNFYEYSGQLFDANSTNDGQRQTSSDGHIVLSADQTRTLIVLNQYKFGNINVTKFNDKDGDGYQDQEEENLSGWTINLTGQTSVVTDVNGLASFNKISFGDYILSETIQDGWMQTNITCDGDDGIDNDNSHQITLTAGQNLNCKIANRQLGKVTVTKFNDLNGNGQKDEGETNLSNWTINLTNQTSQNTDENGQTVFDNLVPGDYDLSENVQSENGWKQTNIYCEDSGNGIKITAPGFAYGHHGNCEGWNECGDAKTCALKACQANGYQNLVSYGAQKPCTQFANCSLFYNINSNLSYQANWGNWCNVMGVTDIVCSNGSGSGDYYNNGNVSGSRLTVNPGQNKVCYIGNQRLAPKTTITKSNNSGGVELTPGNSVEYTINVGFADNSVNNLKVTDLLSNGFKYKTGSYKIYKNGTDVTTQVIEPQYHSPGVWDLSALGTLTPSDTIKLVYTADISTDQQAGKYADLAWSIANYSYDSSKSVLALAGNEGKVDTNFVGTEVKVGGNYQNSVSAEVEQINHTTGQVLGASTELPGTGAATIWMIISGLLGLVGFSLLKFNKKTMLTILLTLLSFGLIISPIRAQTSNLSVRLEEPKTPTNTKNIELKFVALDIQGRGVTVNCLKKGPSDSSFVQFSSETLSGVNGNASHCSLSLAITDNGPYQFQTKAVAGGEEALSNIVSLDYNTAGPGTPNDYRKDKINNCDYKIHFKTANDGDKTVKVELYRSTSTDFSANNESLVNSVNIGSNQEKDIYISVPDCTKSYYYVLRAFDNAGNGSGVIGDTITKNIINNTTTVIPTSGAIPLIGDNNIPKESEVDETNPTEGQGTVLGVETPNTKNIFTKFQSFIGSHKLSSALTALLVLVIIGYVVKRIGKKKK
ncbi:MAG TPA: SdrD B-like domain-containing protein, partial [Candidatus Woesebacteria bacterium]|nr:SdrD B-like domain-containing protein [Candidatus Woesebacteria bacterium]